MQRSQRATRHPIKRKKRAFSPLISFFKKNVFLLVSTLSVGTVSWIAYTYSPSYPCLLDHSIFKLHHIYLEGLEQTSLSTVREHTDAHQGQSLLSLCPQTLKCTLQGLPWVKKVTIQRYFPSTLVIRFIERDPLAVWQRQGKKYLLDTEGEVIPCSEKEIPSELLTVVGETAPRSARALLDILKDFPQFLPRIQAATHLRSNRWDLYLTDKIVLKLPSTHINQVIQKFLQHEKEIYRLSHIKEIDLRFPDRIILRMNTRIKSTKA